MAESLQLSPAGLDAGLATVLEGARTPEALGLLDTSRRAGTGVALAILAANVPGLAVQVLLPALAVRRVMLVKASSREPHFAPFFVEALARHEPALGPALGAVAWPGGHEALDRVALRSASRVVAYGSDAALDAVRSRTTGPLVAHGEVVSFAVLTADDIATDPGGIADAVARDVALLDQRGCLSPHWVFTPPGAATPFARALADALETRAVEWPPGALAPAAAGAVRALRDEALLRDLPIFTATGSTAGATVLGQGTVVVDGESPLEPGPGGRTVRVVPVQTASVPALLAPWRGRLQGAALGAGARYLAPALGALGLTWITVPGRLQSPPLASWRNGGLDPLDALA